MVDMINVRSAQTVFAIGDNGAISVGINYMISGVGTVVQPIVVRRFVAQTPRKVQVWRNSRTRRPLDTMLIVVRCSTALYHRPSF